jgi:transcription antitermination factor NusA-like protein
MEREINEIFDGVVEIRSIAREAGDRSKVAVWSNKENVDATGACIGAKGVRIQSISQQLAGEKIDVILYDERPEFYVAEALKPSKVFGISLDEENKAMVAIVPNEDFSLAIGKKGQNARLAVKLTGWKIDIKTVDEALSQNIPFKTMNEIEREYNNVDVAVIEENPYDEVITHEEVVEEVKEEVVVEETVTEEVIEEVKEEVVAEEAPKAKAKTSIYESTIAYKGSSSLEERTSIEEKAQELATQAKVEEPKKEEVKKEVKVEKKETPKPEEKNYMPIYSQEELDALDAEEEEYEEDAYDYDEYDDDSYYE